MGCVCVDSGVNKFPSSLSYCMLSEGHRTDTFRKRRYLGDKSASVEKPTVTAKVILVNEVDVGVFGYWWMEELDYGYNTFYMEFPYLGINRFWEVRLTNDLSESVSENKVRSFTLSMELLEDNISDIIDESAGDMLCSLCGN